MTQNARYRLLFLTLFLFTFTTVWLVTENYFNKRIDDVLQEQLTTVTEKLEVIRQYERFIAKDTYRELVNDPKVMQIFRQINTERDLQQLRDELYEHIKNRFFLLRTTGVAIMHFVTADIHSFLRVHKPEKFGDDLKDIRYSYLLTRDTKKPVEGFELGRITHAYRYLFPILDSDETLLGAFELSFYIEHAKQLIDNVTGFHSHILIKKTRTNEKLWKDSDLHMVSYTYSHESDAYLQSNLLGTSAHHDHSEANPDHVYHELSERLRHDINRRLSEERPFYTYGIEDDEIISALFTPYYNVENRSAIGWLACYSKDNPILKEILSNQFWVRSAGFILLLLLHYFIYRTLMAGMQLKQKNSELEERVTERTAELAEAKDIAENAARVKAEFLANMSHEIRTPMNSVIGMTELALDSHLNEQQKNYVEKAHTAAKNLLGIINDILDFSKLEAGKLELSSNHFELKSIISHTLHLISIAAKDKKLKTKVKLDKELPHIYFADDLRLGQVLTNLASNAVKFSREGGDITLEVALLEENETEALVQFSIQDEGIGISEANQEKLFQSFSQAESSTTRKFGGTGLGLAISQKIVEVMGGRIWVESKEGEGSTFFFTVRMQKSDEDAVIESTEDTRQAMEMALNRLRGAHLLLVEDNELNQELAVDLLQRNGLSVSVANNGKEALEMLEQERFDGVLMDCQMPVMDGYEATRLIREQERYKALPILAMTANVLSGDVSNAREAGMNGHIAKPINPVEMFVTMAKWIHGEEA